MQLRDLPMGTKIKFKNEEGIHEIIEHYGVNLVITRCVNEKWWAYSSDRTNFTIYKEGDDKMSTNKEDAINAIINLTLEEAEEIGISAETYKELKVFEFGWKPEKDTFYFSLDSVGEIKSYMYTKYYPFDTGREFKTKKQAEEYKQHILDNKINAQILQYKIMNNLKDGNYYIVYNKKINNYGTDCFLWATPLGIVTLQKEDAFKIRNILNKEEK